MGLSGPGVPGKSVLLAIIDEVGPVDSRWIVRVAGVGPVWGIRGFSGPDDSVLEWWSPRGAWLFSRPGGRSEML